MPRDMFRPIMNGLSTFVFAIGFLAGCSAAFALFYANNTLRFAVLMPICVALIIAGLKMREATGELNIVATTSDELANNFEIAKAFGLGARAGTAQTVLAGVAASALTVTLVALAGFITARAFLTALVLTGVYGGILALAKRRALLEQRFVVRNGKRYGAHRRISVVVIPTITIVWLVLSVPEADPLVVALMALGLLWWIGGAFHYVWELFHTTVLALMYGERSLETVRWGLLEWLRYTRLDARVQDVHCDGDGNVTLVGEFDKPEQLKRDVAKLDFVRSVNLRNVG